LPAFLARVVFRDLLLSRPVLCFVDNEAARAGLIRGSSSNAESAKIIEAIVDKDLADMSLFWYARVPSPSNLADAPSRGVAPQSLEDWAEPRELALDFFALPYGR